MSGNNPQPTEPTRKAGDLPQLRGAMPADLPVADAVYVLIEKHGLEPVLRAAALLWRRDVERDALSGNEAAAVVQRPHVMNLCEALKIPH